MAVIRGTVTEGEDYPLVAQVTLRDGTDLVQATASGWDLNVYALNNASPETALYTVTGQPVSQILTTAPVVDGYWRDTDDHGYTFLYIVPATSFVVDGGRTYRFEFAISTASYGVVPVIFEVYVEPRVGA